MIKTCYSRDKNEMRSLVTEGDAKVSVVSFEDDGFLPRGVMSPYRYFCDQASPAPKEEAPLLANLLTVPDLYEIKMNYTHAEIWDDGFRKGRIEFAEPIEEHGVKEVSWLSSAGTVYKKDYYDKFGKLFFTELYDAEGRGNVRTYFAENQPVITVQPRQESYTLMRDGKDIKMFGSEKEFRHFFFNQAFPDETPLAKEKPSRDILILTNSDKIEGITDLIKGLQEFRFHIGAKTQMSEKLHALTGNGNVTLYEGITEVKRNELLDICSYYLDINYGSDICDAVYEAFRHGLMNAGFSTTIHDKRYILEKCIFEPGDVKKMMRLVALLDQDPEAFKIMIHLQTKRSKE